MQTPGSIAGALATLVVHGLPDDYYATLRRSLLDATVAEVSAAAAAHLHPAGLTVVVEGDARADPRRAGGERPRRGRRRRDLSRFAGRHRH